MRARFGKGKLGRRYEFGYVFRLTKLTPNTRRGARGLILPPTSRVGSPNESELLPSTVEERERLGRRPREVALDGAFRSTPPSGRLRPPTSLASADTRHETFEEATRPRPPRISHLKRGYGLRRSRLRGHDGARTWTGWAILTHNLDTLAVQTPDTLATGAGHPDADHQHAETAAETRGRFIHGSQNPRVFRGR